MTLVNRPTLRDFFLRVFTSPRIDLEGCVVRGVTGAAGLSYEARINESKNRFRRKLSPGKHNFSLRAPRGGFFQLLTIRNYAHNTQHTAVLTLSTQCTVLTVRT